MYKFLIIFFSTFMLFSTTNAANSEEYYQLFKNYHACFILYSVKDHKIVSEYNPENRCNERISPDSTFKIPLSLMAFNEGIINQETVFKWDGIKRELPDWNQDLTPQTWLKYSAVWVSQKLTPQLGSARIKNYLASFHYGNQDFSGDPGKHNGLTYAWLSSSLKISAFEQLNFLMALLTQQLPLNEEAFEHTKQNLYLGKLNNGASYYGKTGSGRHGRNERESNPSQLREGWFIGFVEKEGKKYIFVGNLSDKTAPKSQDKVYGSYILKPITLQLLNEYF